MCKGQPGVQLCEQNRLREMMSQENGDLVDTYRLLHPFPNPGEPGAPESSRWRLAGSGDNATWIPPSRGEEGKTVEQLCALAGDPGVKLYTWRGSPPVQSGGYAKYYRKAMRIDYFLVSRGMMSCDHEAQSYGTNVRGDNTDRCQTRRVLRSEICGSGGERNGFLGSDHCPILLELKALTAPLDDGLNDASSRTSVQDAKL